MDISKFINLLWIVFVVICILILIIVIVINFVVRIKKEKINETGDSKELLHRDN